MRRRTAAGAWFHGKGPLSLKPLEHKFDQNSCQTCSLLVISMVACICPISSVPSQPTVTDHIFLRQFCFDRLEARLPQLAASHHSHGRVEHATCNIHIVKLRPGRSGHVINECRRVCTVKKASLDACCRPLSNTQALHRIRI